MKAPFVPLVLIAVLLLAFGAIAAACGDDGELTLEEFFQKLEQLGEDFHERWEALDEAKEEAFASADSEEEAVEVAQDFYPQLAALLREFVGDIDDLNAPAAVEDAHNQAVDAGDDAVAAFEELVEQLEDVESEAEVGGLLGELLIGPFERFAQACFALEEIADENAIDVDVRC